MPTNKPIYVDENGRKLIIVGEYKPTGDHFAEFLDENDNPIPGVLKVEKGSVRPLDPAPKHHQD